MKKKHYRLFLSTDSQATANLVEKSFKSFGFSVKVTPNLKNMIANLREYGPDIFVIDTDMNDFDCDDMCSLISDTEDLKNLPIIILTHTQQDAMVNKHLLSCIYDYVYKPVNPNELLSRVQIAIYMKNKIAEMLELEREHYVRATATTMLHEINQPLSVILLSTELLETRIPRNVGDKEHHYINKIKQSINSITDILYRLNLVAGEDYKAEIIDYTCEEVMLKLPTSDFRNKVLVIDDIDEVRESIIEILKNEHLDVLNASDIINAEKIISAEHQNVSTIFCDLRIGKRSGMELYHTTMKIDPDINFVIITGYPMKKETRHIVSELKIPVINKPFTRRRILSALKHQKAR